LTGTSNYIPYTGIDHLIWCMEARFPYTVLIRHPTTGRDTTITLFNTRPTNKYAVAAGGSTVEANSNNFRRLWLVNLYARRPEIGTAPVFYSIEQELEPEPEPNPDLGGGGCGTLQECQS
jgi:hypothetical protein